MAMNHQRAIEYVVAYMHKQKWCHLAIEETAGTTMPYPEEEPPGRGGWSQAYGDWYDRRRAWSCTAAAGGGVLDVLAVSAPKAKKQRIAIIEVKVTKADLQRDLRAGKMRRYEPQASHVYLALGPDVFGKTPKAAMMEVLTVYGLPPFWGIITIGKRGACSMARRPGGYPGARQVTDERLQRLIVRAARSMAFRRQQDHMHIRRLIRNRK